MWTTSKRSLKAQKSVRIEVYEYIATLCSWVYGWCSNSWDIMIVVTHTRENSVICQTFNDCLYFFCLACDSGFLRINWNGILILAKEYIVTVDISMHAWKNKNLSSIGDGFMCNRLVYLRSCHNRSTEEHRPLVKKSWRFTGNELKVPGKENRPIEDLKWKHYQTDLHRLKIGSRDGCCENTAVFSVSVAFI